MAAAAEMRKSQSGGSDAMGHLPIHIWPGLRELGWDWLGLVVVVVPAILLVDPFIR
jgi:hypothetical protein